MARVALGFSLALFAMVASSVRVAAPGTVILDAPTSGQVFQAGDQFAVIGRVIDFNGTPLAGVRVTVRLLDSGAIALSSASEDTVADGSFVVELPVPHSASAGTYTLVADAEDASVQDALISIRIRAAFSPPDALAWTVLAGGTTAAVLGVLILLRTTSRRHRPPGPPQS
jgi:hypothetical protein